MSRRSSQRFLHSARDRLVISHFTLGKSLKWHFALVTCYASQLKKASPSRRDDSTMPADHRAFMLVAADSVARSLPSSKQHSVIGSTVSVQVDR